MSVNIFHSNKPQSFNDCYFAEPTIKQELSSYANNPLNGCVLLYGAYGTGTVLYCSATVSVDL